MRCPGCDAILIEIGITRRAPSAGTEGSGPARREVLMVCPHWQSILPAEPPGRTV